jgi:predicted ferric reductase
VNSWTDDLLRLSGAAALVTSGVGLIIGLLAGIRLPRWALDRRPTVITVHRQLNLAVLALIVVHLGSFALLTPGGSGLVALVPQTAPVDKLGYSAGVLAFYLALVLGPSYYLQDRIGRRAWLVAHQFAAVTYALALWHTLALGRDVHPPGLYRTLLWVGQIPILALFGIRLYRPLRLADDLDVERRSNRYRAARYAWLRAAVVVGIFVAGFGVLYVALAAMDPS